MKFELSSDELPEVPVRLHLKRDPRDRDSVCLYASDEKINDNNVYGYRLLQIRPNGTIKMAKYAEAESLKRMGFKLIQDSEYSLTVEVES